VRKGIDKQLENLSMKSIVRMVGIVLVAVAATSCVDVTTEIYVKKDGSATVAQAVYMKPGMLAMMQQGQPGQAPKLIDEPKLKAAAAQMGEGVTFAGAEEKTRKDGSKGFIARYNVADINKLVIDESMTAPGGDQKPKAANDDSKKMRFKFTKGAAPTLQIAIPQGDENAAATTTPAAKDPQAEAMMQQMKSMFDGMRMWVRVRVEGTITETNANFVNPKKSGLTLMKVDFGKLVNDPKGFEKLTSLGDNPAPSKVRQAFKGLDYAQVEDEKVVKVKFQ
jgi:hypothetical protein